MSVRARAVTIREYEPGDELAILAAFNRACAEVDPGHEARSLEEWRWRYIHNPAGRRLMLALDEEGAVLAQYAGSPQRALFDGQEMILTQGIDSFSVTETRGLGRRGTFVETGRRFAELYGGPPGMGDPWMWGFPVPRARRVGQRFLGYVPLRSQPLLELKSDVSLASGEHARSAEWSELELLAPALEDLWRSDGTSDQVLAARGAAELRWRYAEHPRRRYELALWAGPTTSGSDQPLEGYAVYRAASFQGREVGLICDGLFGECAVGPLVRWAAACARRDGLSELVAMLPPWSRGFEQLQAMGFRVRPSKLLLVGRSYERALPLRTWAERWYYTLGDTDLC
jgi:hypothetical protein